MPKIIKTGIRPSLLALKQVKEIQGLVPKVRLEIIPIETRGDQDKVTPLIDEEGSDFFSAEIEEALLAGSIDIAIHSAKDLERDIPDGLVIAALTKSISPDECLVSRGNVPLDKLPAGSCIATSSRKRQEAILRFRPDLRVTGVRGNIDERLAQLDSGKFDALVVAHAALIRLGLEQRITQIIPQEIIPPHPLQGRLAVQIRSNREDLLEIFRSIDER
ncbi:MAG: hydroxymethylbilane synthase [Candidatus Omnitrophota bacterium]